MAEDFKNDAAGEGLEKETEGARVFYFRHSMAKYGEYTKKVASDNPHGALDIEAQTESDLTDDPNRDGLKFAREQAHKFFDLMDPQKDIFYVVSSDQRRALDTAAAYAQVAHERGFIVAQHKKTGTAIADKVGGGYVRSLETLSLNDGDAVSDSVFNPPEQLPQINWSAITPEFKERWDKAREVVLKYNQEVKDKGGKPSWGDNAFHCAAEVKHLLPGVKTPDELLKQFKKMLHLASFAQKKSSDEHTNVLAFGHENAPGPALQEATGSHMLANCDSFEIRDGKPVRVVLTE